ncbi:GREB1-related protein [Hymenobacter baengnokdamensis]|uniref:GREB1-related protein n=1 Tax=Hymenobacter baengnokdamensis TaxID=2615203 RepID=UPI001244AA51|nr:hypothetical protein [Hymenobacter baengnokdamensis]
MHVEVGIPSHKRAGRIATLGLLPSAIVCIAESQAAEYRAAHPGAQLVTHPDSVVGLQAKRNWMYQHFGNLLMVDDDLTDFRRLYLPAGEPVSVKEEARSPSSTRRPTQPSNRARFCSGLIATPVVLPKSWTVQAGYLSQIHESQTHPPSLHGRV